MRNRGKQAAPRRTVVVADDYPPVFADSASHSRLKAVDGVGVRVFSTLPESEDELSRRLSHAHTAVFTHSSLQVTPGVLARASDLRHVVFVGPGNDGTPSEAAGGVKVTVTGTPDIVSHAIAEHTIALLLALAHRVPELDQRVRAGEWPRGTVDQLAGKTLGIVGDTHTSRAVARLACGLGMEVRGWRQGLTGREGGVDWVELAALLRQSDAMSVHARTGEGGGTVVGEEHFSLMKPTAFVVSTERGGLLDERALVTALRNQTVAGAALDAYVHEPLPADHPLMQLPNVVMSPRAGASTVEATEASLGAAIDAVLMFIRAEDAPGGDA